MTADASLHQAYEEWQQLAETKGNAIRAGDWSLVAACHHALNLLQGRITPLADAARAERQSVGHSASAMEKAVKAKLATLIELERRNQTLLTGLCQAAQGRLAELDQSRSNLKRLQRSYVSSQAEAWHSFS